MTHEQRLSWIEWATQDVEQRLAAAVKARTLDKGDVTYRLDCILREVRELPPSDLATRLRRGVEAMRAQLAEDVSG